MRRFELHAEDVVDGERVIVGEGVEFSDGTVVLCGMTAFTETNAYTIYSDGISAFAPLFNPDEITWLDKEPIGIVIPEESAAKHGAEAALEAAAIEHLREEIWDGAPLPNEAA